MPEIHSTSVDNHHSSINRSLSTSNSDENAITVIMDDDVLLESMGYKKELFRGLGAFANFAFGFTEVAVLPSFISLYTYGLETGGPAVISWGFLVTFTMTMIVSFSMAEICSAYPSAGSVYHWSAQVVPEKYSALWSYITGWFNYLGNSAGDAAFAFSFAQQMNAAITVCGGTPYTDNETVGVSIAIIFVWSLCNIFRVDQVGFLNNWAAFSQCAVILILLCAVLAVPTQLATTEYVFTTFYNATGFKNKGYVVCLGLLTSIFSFTGYEASAHMAEETTNSRIVAPRGIILTCFATGIGGVILILAMLYSTPNVETILNGPTDSAAVNVFLLQCGPKWAQALSWLTVYVLFFAGVSSVAVTGRITYALMRDKAFPYSDFWSQVHPTLQSPIHAIMFVCIFDFFLLLVPLAGDNGTTAFASITGLTSIGFQVSYALPIALKLYYQPEHFPITPFNLGIWSRPLGLMACIWLFGTSIFFFFPEEAPVTKDTMNWVIVVVAFCFVFATVNWIYNSQYTFSGPPRHKEQEFLASQHNSNDLLPKSHNNNSNNNNNSSNNNKNGNSSFNPLLNSNANQAKTPEEGNTNNKYEFEMS